MAIAVSVLGAWDMVHQKLNRMDDSVIHLYFSLDPPNIVDRWSIIDRRLK